jgi:hypothetical protein
MFVREFVKRKNEVKEAGKSACSMQVTMTEEMQLLFPIKERTLDSKAEGNCSKGFRVNRVIVR